MNFEVIARYLANTCTERERKEVEQWLKTDNNNRQMMDEFRRIWDATENYEQMNEEWIEIEEDWNRVKERVGLSERGHSFSAKREPVSRDKGMLQQIVKVAAIVLFMALMGVLAYQNWQEPEEPVAQNPVLKEISTSNGERVNLTLSDGTRMLVNSGSEIKLPNTFQPNKREVYLEGEAYFNVTENPDSPFIIHSQNMVTEVLGTSFTVRSYPDDSRMRVVVEEGSVSFGSENGSTSDKVVVTGNEMASYDFTEKKLLTRQVDDLALYMSWTEGYFKFREEPLENVAKELERRYDIQVQFEDTGIRDMKLTANLKSRSMSNVLEVIAMSLEIEYRMEQEDIVYFSKQ